MSEPQDDPASRQQDAPEPGTPNEASNAADFLALGIGCLVFVIFFVAIVLVGVMRE